MNYFNLSDSKWEKLLNEFLKIVFNQTTGWKDLHVASKASNNNSLIEKELDFNLEEDGIDIKELIARVEKLLPFATLNGHPRFLAYIVSSPDPIGILGDILAAALNQYSHLYRISPLAHHIEKQTIKWLCNIFNYDKNSLGVFSSGGQVANLIALSVIKNSMLYTKLKIDIRKEGVLNLNKRPVFYTSDRAHNCHKQSLEILGLGCSSLQIVKSDNMYRMDIKDLESQIQKDIKDAKKLPIAIIATAGTPCVGAVDPLKRISAIAKNHNLWFHIDGAYGLPGLIRDFNSEFLGDSGVIKDADSFVFNPHKLLYSPVGAGITFIKKGALLLETFKDDVSFLDRPDKQTKYEFKDLTIENTRPFRALKVWLGLQAHGVNGYKKMISYNYRLARYMYEKISRTDNLELTAPIDTTTICWRYIPKNDTNYSHDKLDNLQFTIIKELEKQNIGFISYTKLKDGYITMRACIVNFRTRKTDIDEVVIKSKEIGDKIIRINNSNL